MIYDGEATILCQRHFLNALGIYARVIDFYLGYPYFECARVGGGDLADLAIRNGFRHPILAMPECGNATCPGQCNVCLHLALF
jgi:hypothetical protein